jgi:ATP-dependent Lhr-like helicase
VIVDEWHELMGNKRGVQVQLALAAAALAAGDGGLGLSATLGNLEQSLQALLGPAAEQGVLVRGEQRKRIVIDTLCRRNRRASPGPATWACRCCRRWSRRSRPAAARWSSPTRSQAELWYQHLLDARPDWAGMIALHHGSLDREVRDWVEQGLKMDAEGRGLHLQPGPGRGLHPWSGCCRSAAQGHRAPAATRRTLGHAPGRSSRATLVPTNSLELVEAVAAQDAVRPAASSSGRCRTSRWTCWCSIW